MFSQYMVKAIDIEMQSRGYTLSNTPDLLVNFNANLQDKTKVTTSPSMHAGGYYGYRGGYYDPWVGYGYGTDTHVSQYTEGTFNIDLVDPQLKRLVWEAVGVGRINDDTFDNLEQKVAEGVPRYFALYPFVAGDGTRKKQPHRLNCSHCRKKRLSVSPHVSRRSRTSRRRWLNFARATPTPKV
jgi:hypothetical protein